jgi:hypothetical protein
MSVFCCFDFNNGIFLLKFSDQLPSVAKNYGNLLLPVANALLCCLNRHKSDDFLWLYADKTKME